MRTLTIIGCGNVGKSLGRLWSDSRVFQICAILNRSLESSQQARAWIGTGEAIENWHQLPSSDVYLIATGDDSISIAAEQLAKSGKLTGESIVFHCSGALDSGSLSAVKTKGAHVASIHPVKSFASPCKSLADFAGTFCGCEGDAQALSTLKPAFESIGAQAFDVDPSKKSLYHAASVLSCNYLTALIELSAQAYEQAGISRETAMQAMQSIVQGTIDNIFKHGTTNALTGPIARGDVATVHKQLTEIKQWSPAYAEIYKSLGNIACDLSEKQGNASKQQLSETRETLH